MSMGHFVLKRCLQGIAVVWGVITVVFFLRFVTPGDAISVIAPIDASPELRAEIARDLGLNQPIHVQYVNYLWDLLHGDMGYSYISQTDASVRVFARLPASIELAVAATVIAVIIAIPLGVISAMNRHERVDYVATLGSLTGISTPNFWLGIMLVLVCSVWLGLMPVSQRPIGFVPALRMLVFELDATGLIVWTEHITLPAITLGTYYTALITRLTRSGMLDELNKMYVRSARAKGLPKTLVRYKHVLRNTLVPVVTVLGLQLGALIGGAVIIEAVFSWPGLGTTLINGVNNRDWPIIQGSLIVIGVGFVLINLTVDLLYARLDPRVMHE